jgi:cytochrome b involved in lipid metabolism
MAPPSLVQSTSATTTTKVSMIMQPREMYSTTIVAEEQLQRNSRKTSLTLRSAISSSVEDDGGVVQLRGQTANNAAGGGFDVSNSHNEGNYNGHGQRVRTAEEILQHRSEDDAWIVVDGKVYDVTQFLETHPGGPQVPQRTSWTGCC